MKHSSGSKNIATQGVQEEEGGEGGYVGSQRLTRGLTHSIEMKKHRISPKLLA